MPPLAVVLSLVPMQLTARLITPGAFLAAALLSGGAAIWGVSVIESRSASLVRTALVVGGFDWTGVETDGLQVIVTGTAPTESARFRALATAGEAVDPARVIDAISVNDPGDVRPPDFSVEILRNADGISLIGLVPAGTDREATVARLSRIAGEGKVADLLDAADNPVPESWQPALDFALQALGELPRSKISVGAGQVAVTAIADSAAEKARIESDLLRMAPASVRVSMEISAPRPVIAPFSLRFLKDAQGARFDACSADTEEARDLILGAAAGAGATGRQSCTIGLGVPSPDWAAAAAMAIGAVNEMGAGTLTFSDADITLVAPSGVPQEVFDRAAGRLESGLPEVFSLKAVRNEPETGGAAGGDGGATVFRAVLSTDGELQLDGRVPDERARDAVQSFARAVFGEARVVPAMRIAPGLPEGWPVRVLAALEALGELTSGSVTVEAGEIRIEGVSGSADARDRVARMLADRLGGEARIALDIRYDEALDPILKLPKPEDCERDLNAVTAADKITFEPGKAVIAPASRKAIELLAEVMKRCSDFPIEVGGHTDAQGREEMNLALSKARALAVVEALMERRVLTGHLTAEGYGETQPVADNESEAGREANRRIEFRLIRHDDMAAAAAGVRVLRAGPETPRALPRPARAGGVASGSASGEAAGGGAGGGAGSADAD
ncbi:MAG: OmpA family protein [Paracoccaceae bacterium]